MMAVIPTMAELDLDFSFMVFAILASSEWFIFISFFGSLISARSLQRGDRIFLEKDVVSGE